MRNSGKWLAALTILIVIMLIVLHFLNRPAPNSFPSVLPPANPIARNAFHFHAPPVPRPQPPELDVIGQPKIPREEVEAWLAKHNRNAMSLLAAFRALGDTNYLNEAATNFPNNPQVELAVLAHDEFPQDRRKWLDLFKASSPSNSPANYLSAQDYFKNGNPDAAVQELVAAAGKSQFDGFQTESRLDEEDLYLSSGYSQLDSDKESSYGIFQEYNTGELQTLKQLAVGISDLQTQDINSGDANSAANLAQMGMNLVNQINSGDSGKYLVNQLDGIATASIILQSLDQNTSYDFLGGETPNQVMQGFKQQLKSINQTAQNFESIYPDLTEEEQNSYFERYKIYGGIAAEQWVIQQHPPNSSQNGQP